MIDPALLAVVAPFDALPAAARHNFASRCVVREFSPGEALFTAGSEARGLFIILDGHVRVVRASDGRQHVVHDERAGGTLGEVPLFSGNVYPATALAAEPTRCAVIGRDAVRAVLARHPEVAWIFLERLASRVRHLVERLDRQTARSVLARLAEYLLARRRGADGAISLGATQIAVAEELGTVREVVVRALRELREAGIVRARGRGRLELVDRTRLERIAAGEPLGRRH